METVELFKGYFTRRLIPPEHSISTLCSVKHMTDYSFAIIHLYYLGLISLLTYPNNKLILLTDLDTRHSLVNSAKCSIK